MIMVKDKVVIITGAGSGMGRAYAEALSRDGAKVVVAEINTKTGEEVVNGIKAKGGEAIFVATDVAKYDTVKHMVETTIKTYNRIDALVNNAAWVDIKMQPFTDITEEDWDRMFEVNVKGIWNCCRAVMPQLLNQKQGKIINVSSAAALGGKGQFLHYTSSKGAVVSMTRALVDEIALLSDGAMITVNTLAPGSIFDETLVKMLKGLPGGVDKQIKNFQASQPLKHKGTVEDMVGPLFYLVSDASNFMTGCILCIDGGTSRY